MTRNNEHFALVTLNFGRSIDQFNFEGVEASLDCIPQELGVLMHETASVPARFVFNSISPETGDL
jgi:hypothetical protein